MSHKVSFGSTISIAFILGMAALPAIADIHHEGEHGSLTFGGDVELDINAQNTHAGQGPIFFEDDVEQGDEFNQTGRVLVELGGERRGARPATMPAFGSSRCCRPVAASGSTIPGWSSGVLVAWSSRSGVSRPMISSPRDRTSSSGSAGRPPMASTGTVRGMSIKPGRDAGVAVIPVRSC